MVYGENNMIVPTEDVCVADEPMVLCIVRDMTDSRSSSKHTLNLSGSTTCRGLIEELGKLLRYYPDTFTVYYERPVDGDYEEVLINEEGEKPLSLVCAHCGNGKKNIFTVNDKDGKQPERLPEEIREEAEEDPVDNPGLGDSFIGQLDENKDSDTLGLGASASPTTHQEPTYGPSNYRSGSSYSSDYSYSSALMKSDTGYVGLVNQAMTCYLNSLLQTLYMTPEFRNAIYRWEFDGEEAEMVKSIPFQLQRLFLLLQTSKRKAVETTDITRSFGWDSSEAWQQHDVQELCRVMFDALEIKWKNTDQAHLINQLYQGKMKDYVKCLECSYESARTDTYLDIALAIRPFGSTVAYGSVEEALKAYTQPEILDGSNQYFCEKCNKKCDAHKGLKFVSFPYLLTMQLKRFDFDYNTLHRIKLNDKMTFPEILNLNQFIDNPEKPIPNGETGETSPVATEANLVAKETVNHIVNGPAGDGIESNGENVIDREPSDEGIDEGIDLENCASGASTASSDFSSVNSEAATNDRNLQASIAKGPYEYELFSIMIHSGSAAGGHYYAYIKSFTDGHWYSFNDQHVTKITYDDIRKTYGGIGGSRGYYSSAYASSTNCYMLMYRQIDKKRNADFMQPLDFPKHLVKQHQALQSEAEEETRRREMDRCMCKIKLFCYHPELQKQIETKLEIHKDRTLKEATEAAYKQLDLENIVQLDYCRLVKYDEYHDSLEKSYEGEEETPMGVLLGGVKQSYTFDLLMEIRREGQKFQPYKPGGVTVKVFKIDLDTETIHNPVSMRAYLTQTISDFKTMIAQHFGVSNTGDLRCVLERYVNDLRLLCVPHKTLKSEGFFRSNKVFVECSGSETDDKSLFPETHLFRLLDRYENTIRILVNIPTELKVKYHLKLIEENQSRLNAVLTYPSQSNQRTESHDIDEGIDDPNDLSSPSANYDTSLYRTRAKSNDIHRAISDTIHRENIRQSGPDGSCTDSISDITTSVSYDTPVSENQETLSVSETEAQVLDSGETSMQHNKHEILDTAGSNISSADVGASISNDAQAGTSGSIEGDVQGPQDAGPGVEQGAGDTLAGTSAIEVAEEAGADGPQEEEEEEKWYFSAELHIDPLTFYRSLTVFVDKRITLAALKAELQSYVGVSCEQFKVYRVYSNSQEFECTRLSENLTSYGDESKLNVKLGRALKKGEYRVKVYQLVTDEQEPGKFLLDTIFAKGMTVLESKKLILPEIQALCGPDCTAESIRLRRKTWKNPGTIYLNEQRYEDDIPIFANWEIFLEVLDGPDRIQVSSQLAVFARQWHPSSHTIDGFQEVVLDTTNTEELREKLSEISDIPVEDIEFAKGRGTFPCEVSVLEIQTDLDWNPDVSQLNVWPLYICDDGNLVYYRDKKEATAELDEEKKKEIQQKENA
ncbi:unnamed protein product, partial [Owenia fusiformis]